MSVKRSFRSLSNIDLGRSRGAVLFVAVGALTILSILSLGTTAGVVQQIKLAESLKNTQVALFAASSLVKAMPAVFAHDPTPTVVTAYDLRTREIPFGDLVLDVKMTDEQSKINIEQAEEGVVARLPGVAGSQSLVDEIVAKAMWVKEDLLLLDSMTPETYEALSGFVTTYGNNVNIHTATEEALSALGIDGGLVSKIQSHLAGSDGEPGTEDDAVFFSPPEILTGLDVYGLTQDQKTTLGNLVSSGRLMTSSEFVCYEIAVKKGRRTVRSFEIVASPGSGDIVSWQEK